MLGEHIPTQALTCDTNLNEEDKFWIKCNIM